ncbi:MAG: hypothetical protein HOC23_24715 [Halieaceae bacterium]|jgi:hypothetical protein|nr:hypothetical protein [Halieaceae bacterium]
MSPEEFRVICVVYLSSMVPLFLVPYLLYRGTVPRWVGAIYAASFLACAVGWELWFTYGWVAGDPVDLRRAATLNTWIPIHINWLLNSLADAGTVCLGGLWLMWRCTGRNNGVFRHWHWGAFAVLLAWCLGQNILVEMFLYHDQLAEGKPLSWAPLAPTGSWYNPTLFHFRDRTITLQGQVSWLLMAPLLYAGVIRYCRHTASP